YDEKSDQFLVLARAGKFSEANKFNTETLRPLYDAYMLALDAAANFVQRQGSDMRDRYAQDSRWFGGLLLAFAGWPLLAAVVGLLVMAVLTIGLIISIFAPGLLSRQNPTAPS